jgi:PST family polysaccharide transporter
LQKIANNVTWLMLQRIVELAIRFFVGAWLVRYLGPQQFGVYSYAVSFVALFADFAALGLDKIVVRDLARGLLPGGKVLATALALRALAAILTVGLVFVVTELVEDEPQVRNAVLVLSVQLLFSPAMVLDLWFQSQVNSKYVVWIRTAVTVAVAGVQAACILAGLSLQAFLILVLVQSVLTTVGLLICFWMVGPRAIRWRGSLALAAEMSRDAWPLLFAGMSIAIYMRIDQVMLGKLVGIEAVGTYGAAVKVSEIWYFVPTALAVSVFPSIVQMRSRATAEAYQRRLQSLYDGMALYSYLVILIMMSTAPLVIDALFGAAFQGSVAVLRVHILSLIFVSLGVIYTRWLVAEDLIPFSMITTFFGAVVNVVLNFALIPAFGAVGAAWATLISYAVAGYLSLVMFRPLRPAFLQQSKALAAPLRFRSIARKAIFDKKG